MKEFIFEITDGIHIFKDAIYLPDDHMLSQEDIEKIKQERFNSWLSVINTNANIDSYNEETV